MARPRRGTPTLHQIAQYWMGEYPETFPNLYAKMIGWGEPFCFRCGWLAAVNDTLPDLRDVWNSAGGWLEKAHLHDHALGGPMEPANLVPLCHHCHDIMPSFGDRGEAIAYINDGVDKSWMWQLFSGSIVFAGVPGSDSRSKKKFSKHSRLGGSGCGWVG